MLLKAADDKQRDLNVLEGLLARPDLDPRTRRQIKDELWSIRAGEKTERDARYEIEFHLGENRNHVTIHDLRLAIEGQVAQIDHVIITRLLEVWVCESKSFSQGVSINEQGEWTTWRDRRHVGIPSPIEQNRRHIVVLQRALKLGYVDIPRRLGLAMKPSFTSVVLISKYGSINRPKAKLPELDAVMKVDQFWTRLMERDLPVRTMAKLVSSETLEQFGRQVVALHKPHRVDWAARFGLPPAPQAEQAAEPKPRKSGLKCAECGEPISYAVAKFCWVNKARFGGNTYCMPCQQKVAPHEGRRGA